MAKTWTISPEKEVERRAKIKQNNAKYWLGKKRPELSKRRIGKNNPAYGKKHSLETRLKMSQTHRKRLETLDLKGKQHERIRKSVEYKIWREQVFTRDNWTCQFCKKRGGSLDADHIKPFAYFPELRFDLNNGRTLCHPCHKSTPTYGSSSKLGRLAYV